MSDVAKQGRTIIFVSHNMGAVRTLTKNCICLNEGRIETHGPTEQVVQHYLDRVHGYSGWRQGKPELVHRDSVKETPVRITRIWVDNIEDKVPAIDMGESFVLSIEIETSIEIRGAFLDIDINKRTGACATTMLSADHGFRPSLSPGKHVITCSIKNLPLTPGEYTVGVGINQSTGTRAWDVVLDYPVFEVVDRAGQVKFQRPWGAVYWRDVIWSIQS